VPLFIYFLGCDHPIIISLKPTQRGTNSGYQYKTKNFTWSYNIYSYLHIYLYSYYIIIEFGKFLYQGKAVFLKKE